MTAAELIAQLQNRGVTLTPHADGEHLRVRPADALDPALLAELRAHRDEVLAELRWQTSEPATAGPDDSLIAPGEQLIAVRIRCPYGDAWLVPNDEAAELLVAERGKDATELPIFTYAEIEVLRTKSPRALRALFVAKAALPGSRLLQ